MDVKHNKNFAKQFHDRYRQALPSAMRGTEGFESIEDFPIIIAMDFILLKGKNNKLTVLHS